MYVIVMDFLKWVYDRGRGGITSVEPPPLLRIRYYLDVIRYPVITDIHGDCGSSRAGGGMAPSRYSRKDPANICIT
jgi:hypothetical protein